MAAPGAADDAEDRRNGNVKGVATDDRDVNRKNDTDTANCTGVWKCNGKDRKNQ